MPSQSEFEFVGSFQVTVCTYRTLYSTFRMIQYIHTWVAQLAFSGVYETVDWGIMFIKVNGTFQLQSKVEISEFQVINSTEVRSATQLDVPHLKIQDGSPVHHQCESPSYILFISSFFLCVSH